MKRGNIVTTPPHKILKKAVMGGVLISTILLSSIPVSAAELDSIPQINLVTAEEMLADIQNLTEQTEVENITEQLIAEAMKNTPAATEPVTAIPEQPQALTPFTTNAEIDSNKELIARVTMSEAGNQSLDGKVAVILTILNRADRNGTSISSVINTEGQYSQNYNGAPSKEVYLAIEMAKVNRDKYPRNMIYFRTKHYHSFAKPYAVIGDHYFSTTG